MDHAADSNALFREFAEHRSETALARLVRDHLDLVYSVALRRCGGQTGLAQDIYFGVPAASIPIGELVQVQRRQ